MEFHLNIIHPNATKIIDTQEGGRARATIVILEEYQILDQGTKGDGTFAWVKRRMCWGELSIGLVYAPNKWARMLTLWK